MKKNAVKTSHKKPALSAIASAPVQGIDAWLSVAEILDALPFYVILVDENHHILLANHAVQEHLGVEPAAVVGKFCPEVIHGTKQAWYACPLEEAAKTGRPVEMEALDRKSGRWIRSAMYPVPGRHQGKRVFFHMVTDISSRKEAEEKLRQSQAELSELTRHLEIVREEEREKIAREMRDELGQTLVTLKVYLSWLLRRLPAGKEPVNDQAKPMYALLDTAINTAMRLSAELRPGALDDLGLAAALQGQVSEFQKYTQTALEFTSRPEHIPLARECALALFRISHEALSNALRHAGATRVRMSLRATGRSVILRVSDNGKGIGEEHLANPKALGLIGMRERARFWGGRLKISAAPGGGTEVTASIPIDCATGASVASSPSKRARK